MEYLKLINLVYLEISQFQYNLFKHILGMHMQCMSVPLVKYDHQCLWHYENQGLEVKFMRFFMAYAEWVYLR